MINLVRNLLVFYVNSRDCNVVRLNTISPGCKGKHKSSDPRDMQPGDMQSVDNGQQGAKYDDDGHTRGVRDGNGKPPPDTPPEGERREILC